MIKREIHGEVYYYIPNPNYCQAEIIGEGDGKFSLKTKEGITIFENIDSVEKLKNTLSDN